MNRYEFKGDRMFYVHLLTFACPVCAGPIPKAALTGFGRLTHRQSIPLDCMLCSWTGRARPSQAIYEHIASYEGKRCMPIQNDNNLIGERHGLS